MTSKADHEAFLKRLKRASRWVREQMRKQRDPYSHPSHMARMEEADKRYNLDSFGVEGWCNESGRNGVEYLNFGDTYCSTILVKTTPYTYSVHLALGGWGPYAGG